MADTNAYIHDVVRRAKAGLVPKGEGRGNGPDGAKNAAHEALEQLRHAVSAQDAGRIVILFTAAPTAAFDEADEAAGIICNGFDPDADILWDLEYDETMKNEMKIIAALVRADDR